MRGWFCKKRAMKPEHLLCPIAAMVDSKTSDESEQVYGAAHGTAVPMTVIQKPSDATVALIVIAWLVCIVAALVGMFRAFGCGTMPTNFGMTGTAWGVMILILGLLLPPVGGVLGIAFAAGGTCGPHMHTMFT